MSQQVIIAVIFFCLTLIFSRKILNDFIDWLVVLAGGLKDYGFVYNKERQSKKIISDFLKQPNITKDGFNQLLDNLAPDKISVEFTRERFVASRKVRKCITCNLNILILLATIPLLNYLSAIGQPASATKLNEFDVFWYTGLACLYIYFSYLIWTLLRGDMFHHDNPKFQSRHQLLISQIIIFAILASLNSPWFVMAALGLFAIFIMTPFFRIPHSISALTSVNTDADNNTNVDIDWMTENKKIGLEIISYALIFSLCVIIHFGLKLEVEKIFSAALVAKPIFSLIPVLIPLVIIAIKFALIVGPTNFLSYSKSIRFT